MYKNTDQELPKALKKRVITPENYNLFMNELSRKQFEYFSEFTKKLRMLETELKALIQRHGNTFNEDGESKLKYKLLAGSMKEISQEMKEKHPENFKKLTARIFDTNKKSEQFQSVKIKKAVINRLKSCSKPEWKDIQIETLIEYVLKDYIESKGGGDPEPLTLIRKVK